MRLDDRMQPCEEINWVKYLFNMSYENKLNIVITEYRTKYVIIISLEFSEIINSLPTHMLTLHKRRVWMLDTVDQALRSYEFNT